MSRTIEANFKHTGATSEKKSASATSQTMKAIRIHKYGGPEGLLKGKRLILVLASGGVYSDGPAKQLDFQEPYLRAVLGFIGLTDIEVVRVEGVAMSTVGAEKAVATATAHSREILSRAA